MFRQAFYSWGLAQFLHPFLMLVGMSVFGDLIFIEQPFDLVIFFLFSVIASSPSLFLGWVTLKGIVNLDSIPEVKFFFWLMASMIIVILNFVAIIFVLQAPFTPEFLIAAAPAVLSIWISSFMLYRQFVKLFISRSIPTNSENQPV